jgi:hypothetical protein
MANLQTLTGLAQSAGSFALQHWKPIAATVGGYLAAVNILPKIFHGAESHEDLVNATSDLDQFSSSSAGA